MKRTRRKFTAKFKTQVVLEAIKERQTLSELAERFKLHPNQVTTWKKEFLNNAEEAFAKKSSKKDTTEKEKLLILKERLCLNIFQSHDTVIGKEDIL